MPQETSDPPDPLDELVHALTSDHRQVIVTTEGPQTNQSGETIYAKAHILD